MVEETGRYLLEVSGIVEFSYRDKEIENLLLTSKSGPVNHHHPVFQIAIQELEEEAEGLIVRMKPIQV